MNISEAQFVRTHEREWQALEAFLQRAKDAQEKVAMADFPFAYRRLCEHLAFAESSGFSLALIARLNQLALQGHQRLYARRDNALMTLADFFVLRLPQAVRQQWRYFALATALFVVPIVAGLVVGALNPEYAAEVGLPYEEMYAPDPDRRLGESRGASSDVLMWGHYIMNNTSIGLRTIAGGALFGVGVFVSLIYNGWHFGIISADMLRVGYAWVTFFPFVITHAAFELTAIVFSGATGLAIARALFMPGRQRRGEAIRQTLQAFFPILIATVMMFFIAAWIEAFWSSVVMAPVIKFSVGGVLWALVLGYFLFVGRAYAATDD